jgi:hypothetical protein
MQWMLGQFRQGSGRCLVGLFFVAPILSYAASLGIARDWATYPAVTQIESPGEIYAIGDAHGDFQRLAKAMAAAGIIEALPNKDTLPDKPEDARWHAGKAILVTLGDMIDKGPRALDVIKLLKSLRSQARLAGGDVVILAGNHEAEFLADPGASKGSDFAAQLKAVGINAADVGACKGEIGDFLCSLSFAARVGGWFFSHGGNSGGRSIAQLTADLQSGVDRNGFATEQVIGDDSILESRLNGKGRAVWIDAGLPARDEKRLLAEYGAALRVAHIVEAHVPGEVDFADGVSRNRGEMFQRFGLLFLIDTGMSEAVNDSGGAVLHITTQGGERAVAICPNGKRTLLWDAVAKQDVGRAAPCPR